MKILLPLDLLQPVEPIVAALESLIDLPAAEVKLLYVHEVLPAYENSLRLNEQSGQWQKKYDESARAKLEEAKQVFGGRCRAVSYDIAHGSTAMTIENIAKLEPYDMTVLVPRSQHGFWSASVSDKVVQHAPGTVVILRNLPSKFDKVLVGTDGSANAEYAISTGARQLRLNKAGEVVLLHAVDIPEPVKFVGPVEFVAALEQNALMQGEAFLASGEKALIDAGVKNVELRLIEEDPAHAVVSEAEKCGSQLILIGAGGHSGMAQFIWGSVSQRIATQAKCSVAVVKPLPTR